MTIALKRPALRPIALPIRWPLLAVLAVALTYSDGFWMTSLQGAIGAIGRHEPPFTRWLRDSTIMLPLVTLALVVGLSAARRLIAGRRRPSSRLAVVVALVVLIGAGVGVVEAAISAFHDYQIQAEHIVELHSFDQQPGFQAVVDAAGSSAAYQFYCGLSGVDAKDTISLLRYATFVVHMKALGFFSALIVVTNLLLVLLVLALLPDRLWAGGLSRS